MKKNFLKVTVLLLAFFIFIPVNGAKAEGDCRCAKGSNTPGYYPLIKQFKSASDATCKVSCQALNNKDLKYYAFDSRMFKYVWNCLCLDGSVLPLYYPYISGYELKNDDECNQKCANDNAKYFSYSNVAHIGTQKVTKTPQNTPGADPGAPVPGTDPEDGGGTNQTATIKIKNPLAFSSVEEFIGVVLTRARQIIVVLALVSIMIGAVMYVLSAGNTTMIGHAKSAITAALIGLAIGIAAPSFLKEIGTILGWDTGQNSGDVARALTLSQIAMNVLNFLLGIFGVLALIMMIIGGMTYLTAAGDENRIDSGKKIFKYSLIGILVAMSSLVVIKQLAKFFV